MNGIVAPGGPGVAYLNVPVRDGTAVTSGVASGVGSGVAAWLGVAAGLAVGFGVGLGVGSGRGGRSAAAHAAAADLAAGLGRLVLGPAGASRSVGRALAARARMSGMSGTWIEPRSS